MKISVLKSILDEKLNLKKVGHFKDIFLDQSSQKETKERLQIHRNKSSRVNGLSLCNLKNGIDVVVSRLHRQRTRACLCLP